MIFVTPSFSKYCFQNGFGSHENEKPAFSNCSGLKGVFEKLHFRDGLAWTEGLSGQIKLRFQILQVAAHADVHRLVTRSFERGKERVRSLRKSAWEARPQVVRFLVVSNFLPSHTITESLVTRSAA